MRAVLVGVAGAAGALSRYGIAVAIGPQMFPWATLGINLSGSFVLAFVVTWATDGHLPADVATGITVGFLGAYTTFSTFSWETFVMATRTGCRPRSCTWSCLSPARSARRRAATRSVAPCGEAPPD